jgi:hypothetical protein
MCKELLDLTAAIGRQQSDREMFLHLLLQGNMINSIAQRSLADLCQSAQLRCHCQSQFHGNHTKQWRGFLPCLSASGQKQYD